MRCLTASLVLLSSNDYCCGLGISSGRGLRYDDMAQLYYVIELSVSLRYVGRWCACRWWVDLRDHSVKDYQYVVRGLARCSHVVKS